jgi:hypothetical protein
LIRTGAAVPSGYLHGNMGIRMGFGRESLASSPWAFFFCAIGWSWLFWIPIALAQRELTGFTALVYAVGGEWARCWRRHA